ncbi:MAG TPA: NADH-quinone oxidoreductase subunit L, partial [Candidatus Aminicenantes bacterium]|nr:NADH-quinone oxidoreductase subunit L [Candidatus Aminicenantes bacterium]
VVSFLAVRAAGGAALTANLFTWIPADWLMLGNHQSGTLFAIDFSLRFDPLTAVMTLVVTGVGLLIHIYSIGYMAEDSSTARYFTYLNLFTFAMLVLVMGGNLAVMFIGWEGVGLCSYLLIGFWFTRDAAANAGKKAFITNRVGDFGFLLGTGLLIATLGTVDFAAIERAIGAGLLPHGLATAAALLLFLGATGKSAQIPLYTWLPDAMEGPTPVSSLIHAATMVTGGVYMVARMNVLFSFSGTALTVVAVVGALTAVYAASMGFVQTDIKRVLAYSTISQIGYMFVGLGVGAFAAGIFHLMTHAFFKSLLFLAAGSVIHALSGEQDMTRMGGLRKHIPWTYRVFLVGALAIAGVPGLSGFFSKDEILTSAFASGHYFVWALGLCGAGMTAFYMFRLIFLTFFGAERLTPGARHHLHESPKVMIVPLQVLAGLAIAGGWVGLPKVLGGGNWFGRFLAPVTGHHEAAVAPAQELMLMALSVGVALAGIALAYLVYLRWQGRPARWLAGKFSAGTRILQNKYYVDDLYNILVVGGTKLTGLFLGHFDRKVVDGAVNGAAWAGRQISRASIAVDTHVVDGSVNGLGRLNQACGRGLRRLQTGTIYTYALGVVIGLVVLVSLVWTFKE